MGKAQRRKIIARLRIQQHANSNAPHLDPMMQELYEPLLQAAGHEHAEMFWSIIESEASGVLAWGVRSGYLLWTRTHPGEVPTKEQVAMWMLQGNQSGKDLS